MFVFGDAYFFQKIIKFDEVQLANVINQKNEQYELYEIPKKNGVREIYALNKHSELFLAQRNLNNNLFNKIALPIAVKGFVRGESYNTYLAEHKGKKYYLRTDIKSFFDSIKIDQIETALKEFISVEEVVKIVIEIVTLNEKLPQGAVTSPCISNIIFRRVDQRVVKYCQEFSVVYTRYADDMLFSSDKFDFNKKTFFYSMIKKILKENGFECNHSKKKIGTGRICLGGFIVENDVHLSRKKLNNINKIIYYFREDKDFKEKKYKIDSQIFESQNWINDLNNFIQENNCDFKIFSRVNQLLDYLCGYRSFLISIIKANENRTSHIKQLSKKVKNLEMIIDVIIEQSE